jgi:dimethylamine monooxygenase subunit C
MKEAIFVPGKRKYLFCGDNNGINLLSQLIERVIEEGLLYDRFLITSDKELFQLSKFLKKQKMGTYLYAALPNNQLIQAKKLAEDIGFSEEEMQFIGYGKNVIRIFCCRCHGINELRNYEEEFLCVQCGLELSVSDHYSVFHNAVLGYVAKL